MKVGDLVVVNEKLVGQVTDLNCRVAVVRIAPGHLLLFGHQKLLDDTGKYKVKEPVV